MTFVAYHRIVNHERTNKIRGFAKEHVECPRLVRTCCASFTHKFIFSQKLKSKARKHKYNYSFYVFQSRLREMVEYDDLAEQQTSELLSLKIADSSKFSQGLIPAVPKVRKITNNDKET